MVFKIILIILCVALGIVIFYLNFKNKIIKELKIKIEEKNNEKEDLKKCIGKYNEDLELGKNKIQDKTNKLEKNESELSLEKNKFQNKVKEIEELNRYIDENKTKLNLEKIKNKNTKIELKKVTKKLEKYDSALSLEEINKELLEEQEKVKKEIEDYTLIKNLSKTIKKLEEKKKILINKEQSLLDGIKKNKERAKTLLEKVRELKKEIAILEEELSLQDFGVYRPKYYFENSEDYKSELEKISVEIKETVRNKVAAVCDTEWTVNNSRREGKKAVNNFLKILIRAFNSECSAGISKVKYNNINVMEARINKAFEMLNKMAEKTYNSQISKIYLELKLKELYLTHEYHEKKEEEKEEQRMIREQMREEEKSIKEYERVQIEAEKEENRYQKALEKAEKEILEVHGEKLNNLRSQIEKLKLELKKAQENKERAISMAQITKSGYVYIISNIGSFGEEVYKIGMTRRLEPTDRVKELGNASVPFNFDIHAMIYSGNAPDLENKLHKKFENRKVNKVNSRREFFKVNLVEIEEAVKKLHGKVTFTKIAEAEQYRKTIALIREEEEKEKDKTKYVDRLEEIMSI